MFAHRICTSRPHLLHPIELFFVNLIGIAPKQIIQKSSSSEHEASWDADFGLRLSGGDFGNSLAFFADLPGFLDTLLLRAAFLSFRSAKFSGDVKIVDSIAFRPRFTTFFGTAAFNGPMSANSDDKVVLRDVLEAREVLAVAVVEVAASDVSTFSSAATSGILLSTNMHRWSSSPNSFSH